jgi:molybdate transport system permease protein
MAMGTRSPLGRWWTEWTGHPLAFTFEGLVIASVLYSLPFAVQPVAAAFAQIDPSLREASATLGASGFRTFARVTLPLSIEGVIAGLVLSFAHTVGEFGVVLMVGGNLPGITRTVSISIYDHVQALEYQQANQTALVLLAFSTVVLMAVYGLRRKPWAPVPIA